MTRRTQAPDSRIVSGARCAWWGSIAEVATTPSGLPCCPHCGGVLFECESEEAWWSGAKVYEAAGHPGYCDLLRWIRGKHFATIEDAARAYSSADTTPPPIATQTPREPRLVKPIIYFGEPARVECDGKCSKAWGINTRERVLVGKPDDIDDYAWLADDELGDAPADPGTYEGGHAKPSRVDGPQDMNKWCVRECERSVMTHPGSPGAPIELRDFGRRVYNRPKSDPRHRGSKE